MNLNRIKMKWRSLIGIALLTMALVVVAIPTWGVDQKIIVDTEQIVAEVEHNLGLGLNFIADQPNISPRYKSFS